MITHRTTWLAAAAVLLAAPTPGAQEQTEGTQMAAPVAYGLVEGTAVATPPFSTGPNAIQRKHAGFVFGEEVAGFESIPVQWSLLPFVGQPFEVDAFSTGQDVVNATTPEGGVSVIDFSVSMAWNTTLFTVESGSPGEPGSIVDTRLAAPAGNGADLFSANLPGSSFDASIAACYPTDTAQLALDAPALGIIPNPGAEMRWVDVVLPNYSTGAAAFLLLPSQPTVYFSVRNDDLALVPGAWFAGTPPSGATILRTTWAGGWSPPVPHLTYAQLGLHADDDIDAVAVEETRCKALFSIASKTGLLDEQLQIAEWSCTDSIADGGGGAGGSAMVGKYFVEPGGETVGASFGLVDGADIDGVCTRDPGGQVVDECNPFFGWPLGKVAGSKELSFQVYRDATTAGLGTITFAIDGASNAERSQLLQLWMVPPVISPVLLWTEPAAGPARRTITLSDPLLNVAVGDGICLGFTVITTPPSPKLVAPYVQLRIF